MGRMRMSGGSPVRMLRGDAAEAMAKAHHAGDASPCARQDAFDGDKTPSAGTSFVKTGASSKKNSFGGDKFP